jgi:hypothetical protein
MPLAVSGDPIMQKTIFITISRAFITRNILRSGALSLLKKRGHTIYVFFPAPSIPEYLKNEFEDEQVKLIALNPQVNRWHRIFSRCGHDYLMLTYSTKKRAFYFRNNPNAKEFIGRANILRTLKILPYLRLFFLYVVSSIKLFKVLYRSIYASLPQSNSDVQHYFDTYKPDLVFSTSITSVLDILLMSEAKQRKIQTISMPKSWDVMMNGYFKFIPDYLLVPNEPSRYGAVHSQNIPAGKVHTVGMAQFDWYVKKDIIKSREEHFAHKGLDPKLPLIFFGCEGAMVSSDHKMAEQIYKWIINNELIKPCQLLARPHFTNADQNILRNLRNKKMVAVDSYRITNFLADKWDPSTRETIDFVNSVFHCDIMINVASTLSLDAACLDKPVINIGFGCKYEGEDKNSKDITSNVFYDSDHYRWVLGTGGTRKVNSFAELKEQINTYLSDPKQESEGREALRRKLCYKIDGQSSARIVAVIDNVLNKSN